MPVSKMLRLTESQLLARVHSGVRGPVAVDLAAGAAPGVSGEATGSSAPASAGRDDQVAQGFILIPWPVSTNRYWRNFKGRMVVSKEAVEYKARVATIFGMVGQHKHTGPVSVSMLMHPRMTKSGVASLVRADLDNLLKVIFDGLNGVAWVDDSQVVKLQAEFADPMDGGGVSISVGSL